MPARAMSLTPSSPEFEKNHFALDGVVGELFARGGRGGKMRRGLLVFGRCHEAKSGEEQGAGKCAADDEGSHAHERKIAQNPELEVGDRRLERESWIPKRPASSLEPVVIA